jgi:hypothetical protein
MLIVTTLVAFTACAYHLSKSRFQVDALLHVRAISLPGDPALCWIENLNDTDYATLQQDQIRLASSPEILDLVLQREELATSPFMRRLANPQEWLSERLEVQFADNSEVMRISIAGNKHRENRDVCAAIVAAVAEEYALRANDQIGDHVRILVLPTGDK